MRFTGVKLYDWFYPVLFHLDMSIAWLKYNIKKNDVSEEGCTVSTFQDTQVTKFFMVMSNFCGSLVWKLLHATILAVRILWWLIDFCKIYATLFHILSLARSPS